MATLLKKIFSPPVFEDEAKTHQAYLLNMILWAVALSPIPYLTYILIALPELATRAWIQTLAGESINAFLFFLMRRGNVRLASLLQIVSFWSFFTATAFTAAGVQDEAYHFGYPLVILIAGLLLGSWMALSLTGLSLLMGLVMVYAETKGWIEGPATHPGFFTWIISAAIFPVIATIQYLTSRTMKNAIQRAQQSEEKYRLISSVSFDYTFESKVNEKGEAETIWMGGAFERMTGYTAEEYMANGGWYAHIHPDDLEKDREDMRKLNNNEDVINSEIRTFTKNGELRWERIFAHPVWNEKEKRVVGIIGAVQDITEEKLAEGREALRTGMLEKVIRLGKQVTEVSDLVGTLQKIWNGIRFELGFDRTAIFLYNPRLESMDGTLGTNDTGEMVEEWDQSIPVHGDSNFVHVLKEPDGIYLTHNYDVENEIQPDNEMFGVKDFTAVAAWAGGKPVAIICADMKTSQGKITNEQLEALRLFAGYVGLAIENARLHSALQAELEEQRHAEAFEVRRRAMLEKVVQLGKKVTESADLDTILERIWRAIHDDLGFDRLGIFLYNPERNTMDSVLGTDTKGRMVNTKGHWFPISEWAAFKKLLEIPDGLYFTTNYDVENNIPEGNEMYGVKDYAAVAVWAGQKPVAAISVDQLVTQRPISAEQLESLRFFAGYAGLAIENARLYSALQKELKQRQTFIEELEAKNTELERFTYTVSHDLKSPLVTITGFLGYLEKNARAGRFDSFSSDINRIHLAVDKMQTLLKDLLELSRIGRIMNSPVETSFGEIVREALTLLEGPIRAARVEVEFQDENRIIFGDRVRLLEVIQNLIDNAVKFLGDQPHPKIWIGARDEKENAPVFFVRDNGMGIDPQYKEQIFGLFNKLNSNTQGSGIGLTIVKRIVEVHGGRIWVESEPGKGTTFYFTIPNPPIK